jgi:mono/diheme cytochrome c family protein
MRHCRSAALGSLFWWLAACASRVDAAPRGPLGARLTPAARAVLPPSPAPAPLPGAANVVPVASLPPATYTADQAVRGKQVYEATCARCHAPGYFQGAAFSSLWGQRPAFALFSSLSNTMPQDNPGSLTDQQYVDVIAYLLQRNSVAAGSKALGTDTTSLRGARIDVGPTER